MFLMQQEAHFFGDFFVYEITNKKYVLSSLSNTFHGRDIFAPVAAHITNGVSFGEVGSRINDFVDLDFGCRRSKDNVIVGKVIYIDRFGNVVTNISSGIIFKYIDYNKRVKLLIGRNTIEVLFVRSYGFVKKGDALASIGSSDFFEIGVNQGNASKKLSVKEGNVVKIMFD